MTKITVHPNPVIQNTQVNDWHISLYFSPKRNKNLSPSVQNTITNSKNRRQETLTNPPFKLHTGPRGCSKHGWAPQELLMKAGDTSEPDRLDSLGAAALSLAQQHGVCYWRPAAKDNAEEKLSQLQACRQERASERSPWKKAAKMGGRPSCTGPWAEGTGLPCRPTRAGREPQDGGEATGCGFRLRRAGPRPRRSESLQVVASTGQCSEPRTGWQGGQERVQTGVTKISFDRKDIMLLSTQCYQDSPLPISLLNCIGLIPRRTLPSHALSFTSGGRVWIPEVQIKIVE